MKTRLVIVVPILLALAAGIVTAQGPGDSPEEVVNTLARAGYIPVVGGELVAEAAQERIDLTGEDNLIQWEYFAGDGSYTDFVAATSFLWGPGNEEDACGLVFRMADGDNYYAIQLDRKGNVWFEERDGGQWERAKSVSSSALATGAMDQNHVVLAGVGSTFHLLINGEHAAQFDDPSNESGRVGVSMSTFEKSNATYCIFLNAWLWDLSSAVAPSPITGRPPKEPTATPEPTATSAPPTTAAETLTAFDRSRVQAVAELEQLGLIPPGGQEIFTEPFAYFEGTGNWYTPLARLRPHTHIVLAGELSFTAGDRTQIERCALLSRVGMDARGAATTFLDVSLTNNGDLLVADKSIAEGTTATIRTVPLGLNMARSHHLLIIAIQDRLSVYVDGVLVLKEMPVVERAGVYGIALIGKGPSARCEGRDIWGHTVDGLIGFENACSIVASREVNLRAGPGTTYAQRGSLSSGQMVAVTGQAMGQDGFIWWRLNTGTWVRSDIVTARGDCSAVPVVSP